MGDDDVGWLDVVVSYEMAALSGRLGCNAAKEGKILTDTIVVKIGNTASQLREVSLCFSSREIDWNQFAETRHDDTGGRICLSAWQ